MRIPRAWHRLVATLVVLVVVGTTALAQLAHSPDPVVIQCTDTGPGSASFTLTNQGSSATTITSFQPRGCTGTYGVGPVPVALGPGASTTLTAVAGPAPDGTCLFDIITIFPAGELELMTSGCGSGGSGSGMLAISPDPVVFSGAPPGDEAVAIQNMSMQTVTSWSLQLSGAGFEFGAPCPGQTSCSFTDMPGTGPGSSLVPQPIIRCVGTGVLTGTLTATGNSNLMDSAALSCAGSNADTGPEIEVTPASLARSAAVGAMAPAMLLVSNFGNQPLTFQVSRQGGSPAAWAVASCEALPCTVAAGASTSVGVTFLPTAIGDQSTTLSLDSNDPDDGEDPVLVTATGTGLGATVTVVEPAAGALDFGQQPVGLPSSPLPVVVQNDGNVATTVSATISAGATDFQVAPSSATVGPFGGTAQVFVTCTPSSPGVKTGTLTLGAGASTVGPLTQTVALRCDGVTSSLELLPSPVAFGPHRAGTITSAMVTARNLGATPVSIGPIGLAAAGEGFTLAGQPTTVETLGPGATRSFDVVFAPTAALEGARATTITGFDRPVAVTGAATVPRYRVAPASHDFGAVCTGTAVEVDLALFVEPSAEIQVTAPTVTGSPAFDLSYVAPDAAGYLAPLAPGASATVRVSALVPAGVSDGVVTWSTDASAGDRREVVLRAEGLGDGLAISPGSLDFGLVAPGGTSDVRPITATACGGATLDVTATVSGASFVLGGAPTQTVTGSPATPWSVRFEPTAPGTYTGTLTLVPVGGAPVVVELRGEARAGGDADAGAGPTTNYYACGCASPGGAASGQALVLLGLGLAAARRRRRPRR